MNDALRRRLGRLVDGSNPVFNDQQAVFGDDALRVKLHALNQGVLFMLDSHDCLILRPRRHLELVFREPISRDHQGVVPRRLERIG